MTGSATPSAERRTIASSPARAPTPTTSTGRASFTPVSCAARTRSAAISGIDTTAAAKAAGRCRRLHRQGPRGRRHRRPAVRLARSIEGRLADARAAAPGAGHRARVRHVGDPVAVVIAESLGAGARRRRAGRGRLRRRCRRSPMSPRRSSPARRSSTTTCPAISATTGTSATRRRSTRRSPRRGARRQARPRQQPPRPQRDGAARRDRRIRSGDRRATRSTRRSQNPHVDPAADGRLRAAHARSTSCGWSRPMSAAGSARRSITTPRRRSSPGQPASSAGRSSGPPSASRASSPMRMAATTSPMPNWRSTRTASSSRSRSRHSANLGAYLSTFAPAVPTYLYATLLAGTYTTPAIYAEVKAVFTNTVPVDAYRGAGRPEATYPHRAHRRSWPRDELAIDPAELRRTQLHPDRRLPYQTPVALQYDSGDYFTTLDMATEGGRLRRLRGAPRRSGERAASCAASASPPISRRAASRLRRLPARSARAPGFRSRRRCASIRPAASRSSPARTATARATRRPSPSWSPTGSASRSRIDRDRPRRHRQDSVRHGDLRLALAGGRRLRRSSRRWTRSSTRARRSPRTCSKRPRPTSSSRTASSASPAPTARRAFGEIALDRLRAAQLSARRAGARARRDRVLRSEELHLPVGHACLPRSRSTPTPATLEIVQLHRQPTISAASSTR